MSLGSTIALIKTLAGGGGGGGTNVVANPTLAGTEADLTGLQVGDTKYKVGGSSGGGVLVVHMTIGNATATLDKTWREIADADLAVISMSTSDPDGTSKVFVCHTLLAGEDNYSVSTFTIANDSVIPMNFSTNTEDGYPFTPIGG